ncbi:MAG: EpsI family protein [Candidatus Omnitrophica bacterium]|nr:EpsI family protein [Candidatus Omnitrophota bacterium]
MKRPALLSLLLLITIAVSFLLPKPEYAGVNILKELRIPHAFAGWRSQDASWQLDMQDDRYNFITDAFLRLYQNRQGDQIMFLILDAGNFHNPKVCYTSSGFSVQELEDVESKTRHNTFKAQALYLEKEPDALTMLYWLCIDRKMVDWTGQKMIELWSSLMNRKKAGLMVRLEIHAGIKTREECIALGQDFIRTLQNYLTTEEKEYLFGK